MNDKDKMIRTYKPGRPIEIRCVGNCGNTMMVVPESEAVLLRKCDFVCVKCGGVVTKFKMPEEKAEDVKEIPKGQRRIDDEQ